ncbi:MAG: hypothetical protein WCD51_15070 [Anaerolineae bacterium]
MDDVFVLLGVAMDVAHVPAQGLEEGVDELHADLGLFVVGAGVDVQVAGEALHQALDLATSVPGGGNCGEALFRAQRRLLGFE